jgi:hypothetical protein
MASVTEVFGSRNGARRGVSGIVAPRRFDVITDNANDDPLTVLAETGGIQAGQPYAWTDFLAFAQDATVEEQRTHKLFRVRVDYTTPIAFTPLKSAFPDWIVQFRGVSFPERIFKEPEKLDERTPRRVLGPFDYKPDDNGQFNAGGIKVARQTYRIREGRDIEVPMAALILNRQVTTFTFNAGIALPFYTKKCNSVAWHGVSARHGYFDGLTVDERFGVPANAAATPSNQESVFYDIQLSFLIRATPWTPEEILSAYTDPESGREFEVTDENGELVTESLVRYSTVDFHDIFNVLERFIRSAPGPTRGGG